MLFITSSPAKYSSNDASAPLWQAVAVPRASAWDMVPALDRGGLQPGLAPATILSVVAAVQLPVLLYFAILSRVGSDKILDYCEAIHLGLLRPLSKGIVSPLTCAALRCQR